MRLFAYSFLLELWRSFILPAPVFVAYFCFSGYGRLEETLHQAQARQEAEAKPSHAAVGPHEDRKHRELHFIMRSAVFVVCQERVVSL